MQTYITILRGINVSGHKIIKMDALRKVYADLNFKNIQSYIQSGNVIFQFRKTKQLFLEKMISEAILKIFRFDVPVIVIEMKELLVVLENNPFVNKRNEDITKLYVTFLSRAPEKSMLDELTNRETQSDEFFPYGKTIYMFCPEGYGNTKLSNTFFEKKLEVSATTRNWKTINELYNIAQKISICE